MNLITHLKTLFFYQLALFLIVSPWPFINKPSYSGDLIAFMISLISSFEIINVVCEAQPERRVPDQNI